MSPLRREREPVRQCAFEIARRLGVRVLEMAGSLLRDDCLVVAVDADDAAAGISDPERAVAFGENALGPLEIAADVVERARVESKIQNWIRPCPDSMHSIASIAPHWLPIFWSELYRNAYGFLPIPN